MQTNPIECCICAVAVRTGARPSAPLLTAPWLLFSLLNTGAEQRVPPSRTHRWTHHPNAGTALRLLRRG